MERTKLKEIAELYGASLSFEQALCLLLGQAVKEDSLQELVEMGVTEVMRLAYEEMLSLGLTKAQAHKLKAVISFTQSFQEDAFVPNLQIRSPEDAAKVAIQYLKGKQQEHVVCMYLDTKNQVKHMETIFIGSLNASIFHPREVLLRAIKMAAAGLVIFHNHPSNALSPSPEDIEATLRLDEAGKIVGIALLDHLIVNDTGFFSLKEHGLF